MRKNICPVCGEKSLSKHFEKQILKEPFGRGKEIEIVEYRCNACGSSGDFFHENDILIEEALSILKAQSVKNILNDFSNDKKIQLSAIERVLSLPQRTLTKWKNGAVKPSAAGVALLKIIGLFPWILEVAENKFNYDIAQSIFIESAVETFMTYRIQERSTQANEASSMPSTQTDALTVVYSPPEPFIDSILSSQRVEYGIGQNNISPTA